MRDRGRGHIGGETQGEKVLMRKRSGHRSKVIQSSHKGHHTGYTHCGKMNAVAGGMLM